MPRQNAYLAQSPLPAIPEPQDQAGEEQPYEEQRQTKGCNGCPTTPKPAIQGVKKVHWSLLQGIRFSLFRLAILATIDGTNTSGYRPA
jgi:hypothetical protein